MSSLDDQCRAVKTLANKLNNVTIVKKGKFDIISDGNELVVNRTEGGLKRCGGIGDLLAGSIGTFAFWTHERIEHMLETTNTDQTESIVCKNPCIIAAYAASTLIKRSSQKAYEKLHRSLVADDILKEIPAELYSLFDATESAE